MIHLFSLHGTADVVVPSHSLKIYRETKQANITRDLMVKKVAAMVAEQMKILTKKLLHLV
jgi:hypothetical protein